jgi:acid phosphatase
MPQIRKPLACLTLLAIASCASLPDPSTAPTHAAAQERHEGLNAVLWMQRSLEFRISAQQVYRDATAKLAAAVNKPGTAAAEQEGQANYAALPPAVVLDIDETVLDNSRYQAWRIKSDSEFEMSNWQPWVRSAAATAIPGALEFTLAAQRAGIRVIYISNRECPQVAPAICEDKNATVLNLKRAGFPLADAGDVMFRGERAGWGGKESRREDVAKRYRIVMMIGDDLRDLLPTGMVADLRKPGGENAHAAHVAKIGERLFLIPNSAYGSWEDAIGIERCKSGDRACANRVLKRKYDALETFQPATR